MTMIQLIVIVKVIVIVIIGLIFHNNNTSQLLNLKLRVKVFIYNVQTRGIIIYSVFTLLASQLAKEVEEAARDDFTDAAKSPAAGT